MSKTRTKPVFGWALCLGLWLSGLVQAQQLITYQGNLKDSGVVATGLYDIRFTLYDAPAGGVVVDGPITREDVPVQDGVFSTELAFGAGAFNGQDRWLEVALRDGASTGGFEVLQPRQRVTGAPVAHISLSVAPDSVGTLALQDGAVSANKIAADAVDGATVADGSLTAADLADGAITGSKIATGAVGADEIAAGAVGTAHLSGNPGTGAPGDVLTSDGAGDFAWTPQANVDAGTLDGVDSTSLLRSDANDAWSVSGITGLLILGDSNDRVVFNAQPQLTLSPASAADNGIGTRPNLNLDGTKPAYLITCQDVEGCTGSIADGSAPGQVIVIVSSAATSTTTFIDSGTLKLAGDAALGASSTLVLIWDGSSWVEISRSIN